jgi:hypothetical protein
MTHLLSYFLLLENFLDISPTPWSFFLILILLLLRLDALSKDLYTTLKFFYLREYGVMSPG